MIKLDKVSKYYYSNGMVSSGISKVSLELNMGEFIAITGASGSGKSTLLNVISGLDTYEDGEMLFTGSGSIWPDGINKYSEMPSVILESIDFDKDGNIYVIDE